MLFSGGTSTRVICSDCYDNANIYSRTREHCPYTYIAEEDVLDQTLSSLMVQMPKETYLAHPSQDAAALESLASPADGDLPASRPGREQTGEGRPPSMRGAVVQGTAGWAGFGSAFTYLICFSVTRGAFLFDRKQSNQ